MLEINSISVGYGERLILKDISLTVHSGEIVALIGPNGTGKSTLIRAVGGVLPIRSGSIGLCGRELGSLSPDKRARTLAVVPQAQSLPTAFNVYQTILLGRTPYLGWLGQAGHRDHDAVQRAMLQTKTHHLGDRCIGELSGGEQQRVLLARALAQATPILIMDEPTNHLDISHQTSFLNLARQLAVENGLAILVALHDLNLTSLYADRVAVLEDGELRAFGTPEEVFLEETLSPIYGSRLQVITHPEYGTPLVLPAGPDMTFAPHGRGYKIDAPTEVRVHTHA
jgi:iron complex transport system ATP-binding protein